MLEEGREVWDFPSDLCSQRGHAVKPCIRSWSPSHGAHIFTSWRVLMTSFSPSVLKGLKNKYFSAPFWSLKQSSVCWSANVPP